MDEQQVLQNQQQIVTQKRTEEQNRMALIPKGPLFDAQKEIAEKKTLTREQVLEQKKQNALSLAEKKQMQAHILQIQEPNSEAPKEYTLDQAKDPAVALLLENLKRDVVTAKRKYDAAVSKEVERLQQITNQADVEKYMKKKAEE